MCRRKFPPNKIYIIITILFFTINSIDTPAFAVTQAEPPRNMRAVAKQIFRDAVRWGIEEAGTRLMGSVWEPFKKVITPVVVELKRRYPSFALLDVLPGEVPGPQAKAAAQLAIQALERDERLYQLMLDSFTSLHSGQQDIINELARIESILLSLQSTLAELDRSDERRFMTIMDELARLRRESAPGIITWGYPDHALDTLRRSAALGLQFAQNNKIAILKRDAHNRGVLHVKMRAKAFEVIVPVTRDWKATARGRIACRPTHGLHVSVSENTQIYQKLIVGEESGFAGFFGCAKALVDLKYGSASLIVYDESHEGYNFFVDERFEQRDHLTNILYVSRVTYSAAQRNLIKTGHRLFFIFYIDLNGNMKVDGFEIDRIIVHFVEN